jgi:hypothetical protein
VEPKRTDVFALELAGEMALDEGGLTGAAIANEHKLEARALVQVELGLGRSNRKIHGVLREYTTKSAQFTVTSAVHERHVEYRAIAMSAHEDGRQAGMHTRQQQSSTRPTVAMKKQHGSSARI